MTDRAGIDQGLWWNRGPWPNGRKYSRSASQGRDDSLCREAAGTPWSAIRLPERRGLDKVVHEMQLTSFTDYALRVLLYSAVHPETRCRTEDVATTFGISRHHVVKVVNELRHLGYIETTRGRDGGFTLARSAQQIRVGDVVRHTEGTMALVECLAPVTNTCPLTRACGLKGVLEQAFDAFLAVLDRYTLADLLAEPRWVARLTVLTPVSRANAPARAAGVRRGGAA